MLLSLWRGEHRFVVARGGAGGGSGASRAGQTGPAATTRGSNGPHVPPAGSRAASAPQGRDLPACRRRNEPRLQDQALTATESPRRSRPGGRAFGQP
jgi:hypothetical protein